MQSAKTAELKLHTRRAEMHGYIHGEFEHNRDNITRRDALQTTGNAPSPGESGPESAISIFTSNPHRWQALKARMCSRTGWIDNIATLHLCMKEH